MSNRPHHPSPSTFRVGCAGWALSAAVGSSFPAEGTHLERYARVFSCVEINSSFYRSHQAKTYSRWGRSVPDDFRFSVKMPRTITHDAGLRHCEPALAAFLEEISALEARLGCILIQLPPSLVLDIEVATRFFRFLRNLTHAPVVCEPRHASWFNAQGDAVLREADVSAVWAHPSPVAGAELSPNPKLRYLRLHGAPHVYYSAYDDAFIHDVASMMRLSATEERDTWCIFDNTARGAAIPNAFALMDKLRIGPAD